MSYAQVLTEGTLIRLQAGGQVYFYHSGSGGEPFLCESSSAQGVLKEPSKLDELVPPPDTEID